MPKNIFKIYDGRTHFLQWDTRQKLIILDDSVTEVQFSNRNMTHSIQRDVYEKDGIRLCNVPSDLLKLPRNLVADAYADGSMIKSVKFAVAQRPMPSDYVSEQNEDIEEKLAEIDIQISHLNANKADDIYYDEGSRSIQLTANGEMIGGRVKLSDGGSSGIDDCKIDDNGHLIVTLSDGRIIDAGYVGSENGATFTPHVSDDLILSWTNDKGLENPEPVDISPANDWVELGDDGEASTQYTWDFM